ncbi:MAG: hypothetical protein WCO68_00635 [Verrucomicrobiota bacterium]
MKKILPLLLLLAVALSVTACKQSGKIPSPESAATDFFQKISESRFQEAYDSAAFGFRAQTDFPSFQATAKELGLNTGTVSCNWLSEERTEEEDVKLTGELLSGNGARIPVHLTLIQERRAWRVFTLRTPSQSGNKKEDRFSLLGKGGGFKSSANRELPSLKSLQKLTESSLLLLNRAVQQGDFNEFYNTVSLTWQNQLTVNQLKREFQPFIDAHVDISDIQQCEPVFDTPPEITSEGILSLDGHYETRRNKLTFSLHFIFEFPYWKLYGVKVQIRG